LNAEPEESVESVITENEALKSVIAALESKIDKNKAEFEAQLTELEKKPFLDRVKEMEDADTWKFFEKEYKKKDVKCLSGRIATLEAKKKAAPPIITKTVEEEKETSTKVGIKEILESVTDPELKKRLKERLGEEGE